MLTERRASVRQEELNIPEKFLSDAEIQLQEEQKWFVIVLIGAILFTVLTMVVGVLAA